MFKTTIVKWNTIGDHCADHGDFRGGSLLFGVLLLISLIGMTELYKVFRN